MSSGRFKAAASPTARVGFANVKAKKLVRAGVELDGDVIARVFVAGDMHVSPPEAMDNVGAALDGAGKQLEDGQRVISINWVNPIDSSEMICSTVWSAAFNEASRGVMSWQGLIRGDEIQGIAVLWKPDGKPERFLFKGTRHGS